MTNAQLILIAGPYRSGTNGDPVAIARNLARLEEASWPIFERGHVPMIGEWAALPTIRVAEETGAARNGTATATATATAQGTGTGTAGSGDIMYETAARLLQHCDAVLRLPGESSGADTDVAIARERGIPVYFDLEEIPVRE